MKLYRDRQRLQAGLLLAVLLCGPVPLAWGQDGEGACGAPYAPSNIVEVVVRYSTAMEYLADGAVTESCRQTFAKEFIAVFAESIFVTDGCLQATQEDVDAALAEGGRGSSSPVKSKDVSP
ncbi:MAG: hypothetical protein ACE5ER_05855 [Nitrospinaceae bacterium]